MAMDKLYTFYQFKIAVSNLFILNPTMDGIPNLSR
jgi:hypothetical protein